MRRLIALCASALLCLLLLPVSADWSRVTLPDGTQACKESVTHIVVQLFDAKGKPYTSTSSGTTGCNGARSLWNRLMSIASAAPVLSTTICNPDGTCDTAYPLDAKNNVTVSWNDTTLATAMAIAVAQNTGTATDINLLTYCTGTGCATATYSLVTAITGWSIANTSHLINSGVSAGSSSTLGTLNLKVMNGSSTDTSAPFSWSYIDPPTPAIKTQPGVYGAYNKTCIPLIDGVHGCTKAELLSAVNTEVCPNSYLVGMKIVGLPSFFLSDTIGVYTGTSPDRGFAVIDAVLSALQACNKYLIIQAIQTVQVYLPSIQSQFYPKYTYDSSFNSDGTASAGTYGFWINSQASQPSGTTAKLTRDDWRDLAIAAATAYCARYDSNPAFYGIGMIYWNTSLPLNAPLPVDYNESTFNNQYRTYLAAARTACPHTNVLATLDFANPYPAQMSTWLAALSTSRASLANNDVLVNEAASWGQQVYAGEAGSPSVIDYRGVVRDMEEVEVPDMCGSKGTNSPATIYSLWRNGTSSQRPRWPTHIVVYMAADCDGVGTGWQAWKTYLSGLGGLTVMNGHDNTLRTPAAVKAGWCETSLTCQ